MVKCAPLASLWQPKSLYSFQAFRPFGSPFASREFSFLMLKLAAEQRLLSRIVCLLSKASRQDKSPAPAVRIPFCPGNIDDPVWLNYIPAAHAQARSTAMANV
ncbi:hypothetical protein CSQ89_18340 [Chitinimonas sp. BJB300]|nr:hypothetical protein CSQ89_18340 [Chitinimonas sp. BJB300]